ncbi:hypothetical protein ACGFRB_12200 [Streptomyces sp. NPDC048718]|uniref:hypothetical protein n=1 Tax=Streptomyces sp. NPDC048718 TaxID=3365587 RepID=UPI003720644E
MSDKQAHLPSHAPPNDSSPLPAVGSYVVDTGRQPPRIGEVTALDDHGVLYLRPPCGGTEWNPEPADLRAPTEAEREWIRALTTPVRKISP